MNFHYPNAVLGHVATQTSTAKKYQAVTYSKPKSTPLRARGAQMAKRAFDIAFSMAAILFIFSWLFPILMIMVKATSKGPIFFKQKRHGLNNQLFDCLKFRTMYVNNNEGVQASKNDSRITPIGAFLRKTSLDELPQFINVLLGDMSIVGPRPHFYRHNEIFAENINGFMMRHLVKPGVTGLAQTRGYRGETNSLQDVTGRFKLDMFYIENWNFALDLRIVIDTVKAVLFGDKHAY